MATRKKATLVLQNGRKMEGWAFGYDGPCDGEVVFSTAMVGYTESLTDLILRELITVKESLHEFLAGLSNSLYQCFTAE